ncbi:MAG: hypothetical protein M1829_002498 [Trizodia sp. TS-e1964]|nr:MAG: hypothetical protein M1829_002498 [Trizodia sp. TS-e1964]
MADILRREGLRFLRERMLMTRSRPTSFVRSLCALNSELNQYRVRPRKGAIRRRSLHSHCALALSPGVLDKFPRLAHGAFFPDLRRAGSARRLATVQNVNPHNRGPIDEYNARVDSGRLRNDEHQRNIVEILQHLSDDLKEYQPPKVIHPDLKEWKSAKSGSIISNLFHLKSSSKISKPQIPENTPKGLYLFGDVGCGKTMLMDMFYDTLPRNITSKTRIHFHNFMQDVHKRLHDIRSEHGFDFDAVPFVAADIAEKGSVLCFDEFQCTDVADAMILRRLLECLLSHGIVLVTTSNRHPDDLYKNGIQRESFIPCINLLKRRLQVINLDSMTDYRKIPRPPSGVFHSPLNSAAAAHAEKWFNFLGDPVNDPPHRAVQHVWGRDIEVPRASGSAAMFTFEELIGRPTGAGDYLELARSYESFIVTNIPGMTYRQRDLARRFITFIDTLYESRAKLVVTSAVPMPRLFVCEEEVGEAVEVSQATDSPIFKGEHQDVDEVMHSLMEDPKLNMEVLKNSDKFTGDEERFAFSRALSRLSEMSSLEWVERGLGLEKAGGLAEKESWQRVRSRWREDSM